jgi:hypothetical protein
VTASPHVDQLGAFVRSYRQTIHLPEYEQGLIEALMDDVRTHVPDLTDQQRGAVLLLVSHTSEIMQRVHPEADARFIANLCGFAGVELYRQPDGMEP